jgi:predicted TPR repeat methyltransferase
LERINSVTEAPEQMSQNSGDYELRYFGHGFMGNDADEPKSVILGTPGQSYIDALGTVFLAAAEFLKLPGHSQVSIEGMRIDQTYAIEKLRHHGFRLLRLDEFMKSY